MYKHNDGPASWRENTFWKHRYSGTFIEFIRPRSDVVDQFKPARMDHHVQSEFELFRSKWYRVLQHQAPVSGSVVLPLSVRSAKES
jgi:hypothetical protein